MIWMFRVLMEVLRIRLSAETAFRMDLLLDLMGCALYVLGGVLFFEVIYGWTETIGGWSRGDALALVGTLAILLELQGGLLRGLRRLPHLVEEGKLALFLVRPAPVPFLLALRNANPIRTLVRLPLGVAVLIYAISFQPPSPVQLALYCLSLLASLAIYSAMIFCLVCLSFWFYELNNLFWIIDDLIEFARYPESVYRGPIRVLLSTVLPFLLLANPPVRLLRGESWFVLWGQVAVLAGLLLVGWFLWRRGLLHFEGAGM